MTQITVSGLDHVDITKPHLYALNHISALDIPEWQRARSLASLAGYVDIGQGLDARGVVEPVTDTLVSELAAAAVSH